MADKAKKDDQLQKKKEDSSDRESSVESFHTNKSEFSTAAESELIDVDDIELSDEESWLYKSPKKLPSVDKTLNTYKWLNKDKDNLEVQDTKDALVRKLNQLQKRNDITEKHLTEENISLSKEVPDADNKSVSTDKSAPETNNSSFNTEVSKLCTGKIPSNVQDSESVKGKENDVLDVHRIAQLQEENQRPTNESLSLRNLGIILNPAFTLETASISNNVGFKISILENKLVIKGRLELVTDSHHGLRRALVVFADSKWLFRGHRTRDTKHHLLEMTYSLKVPLQEENLCGSVVDTSTCQISRVMTLNVCNGKLDDEAAYTPLVPMQTLKKQNQFGSSSFLHQQDAHRGSLPNINPGYYSLRSKKSKKSLDQKLVCPLPLSPSPSRLPLNGAGFHASSSVSQSKLTSPLADYCESRTLPSSYRIHSRSNSSSRKDLNALSPSPRRESTPFLSHARSNSSIRRDSAPGSGSKYLSPMSSPTLYQRNTSSSPYLQSPTQPRRNPPKDLKTVPPNAENTSHSPSRRKPLSTVHNCSPKRANSPASPRKEDLKGCKLSSKIPSPGPSVRSGIPVPSSYSSRMASDDESWSHDCF
ncbi:hypothetical protein HNY73_012029 [Argiope bruennichi]|uniref:Uncharacterized protein n=1 Tax=Argiope bruennichi TaxID=94029 RepID=A0A8T0ETT7_ARGBR|nr:hypothetical protein HNY73_012029 [Argiope bruennichi]